jgi:hypothetical protein
MKKHYFLFIIIFVIGTSLIEAQTNASIENDNVQFNKLEASLSPTLRKHGDNTVYSSGSRSFGNILDTVTPGSIQPWGVACSGKYLYLTEYSRKSIFQYNLDGTPTGYVINANYGGPSWIGDLATDDVNIYACNVGGDNAINVFNIATGALVNTITGDWTVISQRGLAYDASAHEFYIGGWNSDTIWRTDNLGNTIEIIPAGDVSGLAWDPVGGPAGTGSLWVVNNDWSDIVTELDPNNSWATLRTFPIPNGSGFSGAGLDINRINNLWVTNQTDFNLYLVEVDNTAPVPLNNWALGIAIMLMISFVIYKFRGKLA